MSGNNVKNKLKNAEIFTIPNILSFFRICLIPVIVWLYCIEERFGIAGWLLILSWETDIVDGFIARTFHMVSELGKVLDPVADKLTQAAMLVCLILRFPLVIIPFALLIAKETFMSISGILVIQRTGKVFGAELHGKLATGLLYGMMILHTFWYNIPIFIQIF